MRRLTLAVVLIACAGSTPRASTPSSRRGGSDAWSFAVLGDSRDDSDSVFPSIAAQIHDDPELAFTIHLGDMVSSGGKSQLKDFLRLAEPLRGCLFPVIGNHETYRDPGRNAFKALLRLKSTSYSFDYKNAHIAVIDNASQEFSPVVLEWLRADLAKHRKGTDGVELVFVAMHIPPAVPGLNVHVEWQKADKFQAGSTELLALLREYGVDVIFAGHLHAARTINIQRGSLLVISGAAGAPQGWLKKKTYGYHRVMVSGAEVRATLVRIAPGAERVGATIGRGRTTCPAITNVLE